MPPTEKVIEITILINIDQVTCPGVWLCQSGFVALTLMVMGTSYQTRLVPPIFPLVFKDTFYFRKKFPVNGHLRNVRCILKDETIYCELVQWCDNCKSNDSCQLLAQYLGSVDEMLFPPEICTNRGVDLLMQHTSKFPGILSPKIVVSTRIRVDDVSNSSCEFPQRNILKLPTTFKPVDSIRQKPVCHSALYHRTNCHRLATSRSWSKVDSSSGNQNNHSRSCSPDDYKSNGSNTIPDHRFHVNKCYRCRGDADLNKKPVPQNVVLESRYVDSSESEYEVCNQTTEHKKKHAVELAVCVCDICTKYHDLFHTDCG